MKNTAFTLAEVLITLGIIGVVAALTLPALIANYQKQVIKEQFKVAYSLMQQAWKKAEVDFGAKPECYYWINNPYKVVCAERDKYGTCTRYTLDDGSPLPSDGNGPRVDCSAFMDSIKKNLQIVKTCEGSAYRDGCIPAYKGLDTVKQSNSGGSMSDEEAASLSADCFKFRESIIRNNLTVHVLKNGVIFIPYNPTSPTIFALDVNGMKGPNKWGHDIFSFETRANIDTPLRITQGRCMAAEKGGVTTEVMLSEIYK